mmetsp:Transcript_20005/g.27127  ORF Transcript_20005/g.27127 Transcript_20005/m.27127 type:complete len:205 (-) Transcript_20005:369-983(-)
MAIYSDLFKSGYSPAGAIIQIRSLLMPITPYFCHFTAFVSRLFTSSISCKNIRDSILSASAKLNSTFLISAKLIPTLLIFLLFLLLAAFGSSLCFSTSASAGFCNFFAFAASISVSSTRALSISFSACAISFSASAFATRVFQSPFFWFPKGSSSLSSRVHCRLIPRQPQCTRGTATSRTKGTMMLSIALSTPLSVLSVARIRS